MNKRLQYLLVFLSVVLIGGLIYSNTLSAQFVFDSNPRIKENQYLRISSLSPGSLTEAVFNEKASKSRPLPNLSFALNYYFDQYDVKYYHVVNILLHIITGLLLFFLFETLLRYSRPEPHREHSLFAAFAAALIWLVHPVHTQSVTYIVQRANVMAALFCILSLLMYIYSRRSKRRLKKNTLLAVAIISWLLALGCKQNAAVWPFIICLYEWYFIQDMRKAWLKENLKYLVGILLLFSLIAFIYLGPDPMAKLGSMRDFAESKFTLTERVLTQFRVVVHYLSLFIYPNPSRLNLDYDFHLSYSLLNPVTTLFAAVFIAGVLVTGCLTARKQRLISFCIFWFFVNLILESSIIPLAIIFEHRAYMPYMGLALLTVLVADRYLKLFWPKMILLCLIVSVSAIWTYQRNETWRDPVTLWQDAVIISPAKFRPQFNLARELYKAGRLDEAISHYQALLKIEPGSAVVLENLGLAFKDQNKIDAAIEAFKSSLEGHPQNVFVLNHLGLIYIDRGNVLNALEIFKRSLEIEPDNVETHVNLGAAYLKLGQLKNAILHLEAALKLDPIEAQAHTNLGIVLIQRGDFKKGFFHIQRAVALEPENSAARENFKRIMLLKNQVEKQIAGLLQAVDQQPTNLRLYSEMAELYQFVGERESAIIALQKALEIDADSDTLLNSLGNLYLANRQYNKAAEIFNRHLSLDPGYSLPYYNFARLYGKQKKVTDAVAWLIKATDRGYANWEQIKSDPCLESIRGTPKYKALLRDK